MSVLIFIILPLLSRTCAQWTTFTHNNLSSTGACVDNISVFEAGLTSVIQCMFRCWRYGDCNGVTYNPTLNLCTGYKEPWHGVACASETNRYYVRELTVGTEAWQSSTYCLNPGTCGSSYTCGNASRAIDGNTNGVFCDGSCIHQNENPKPIFWAVKLKSPVSVNRIIIFPRTDANVALRWQNLTILVTETKDQLTSLKDQFPTPNASAICGTYRGQPGQTPDQPTIINCTKIIYGQYVMLINSEMTNSGPEDWDMCEVVIRPN